MKIIHLRFQKEDRTVTEGHREGVNEPAQRQQPAIARLSAAPYQHLFYSARIRNTKGHKVPIHQRECVIMLMRCISSSFPANREMGHKKTELNSVPVCSAMRNQTVQITVNSNWKECLLQKWVVWHQNKCQFKSDNTHVQSESSSLSPCVQNFELCLIMNCRGNICLSGEVV